MEQRWWNSRISMWASVEPSGLEKQKWRTRSRVRKSIVTKATCSRELADKDGEGILHFGKQRTQFSCSTQLHSSLLVLIPEPMSL